MKVYSRKVQKFLGGSRICFGRYLVESRRGNSGTILESVLLWFWREKFTEIYRNLDEVILEQYWRVFYSGFGEVSPNYYFSKSSGTFRTSIRTDLDLNFWDYDG